MNKYLMKLIVKISDTIYPLEHPEWLARKLIGLSNELHEDYGYLAICESSSDMFIAVTTYENNFSGDPYIIVYNNSDMCLATKCARISLSKPNYITIKSYGLKGSWKLNQKEIRKLINILNSAPTMYAGRNFENNYDYAVQLYESIVEGIGASDECKHPLKLDMPDYTKLK